MAEYTDPDNGTTLTPAGYLRDYAKESFSDRSNKRRSDNAKAFRELVEAKTSAGEVVDPLELERVRLSMSGGDVFGAAFIPKGEALKEMASKANEQSKLSQLKIAAESSTQRDIERSFVEKIVHANSDKTQEEFADIFDKTFGQDGARIYDQYSPEIESMASEANFKKANDIITSDTFKNAVKTEEDLYKAFPMKMRDKNLSALLKGAVAENAKKRNMEDYKNSMDVVANIPERVLNDPILLERWKKIAAQGIGYESLEAAPYGDILSRTITDIGETSSSASDAKMVEAASKSADFSAAAKTGDEELIFQSVKMLMVAAGKPAPLSPNDPSYLRARKILSSSVVSTAMDDYEKRKAELTAAAAEEVSKMKEDKRAKAVATVTVDAIMPDSKYRDDGAPIAPIENAIGQLLVSGDFVPSASNMEAAVRFIKEKYDEDSSSFSPDAVVGEFLSSGKHKTSAEIINERVNPVLEAEGKFKPGRNYKVEYLNKMQVVVDNLDKQLVYFSSPVSSADVANYNRKREATVASLKQALVPLYKELELVHNDPYQRSLMTGYSPHEAVVLIRTIRQKISEIESMKPVVVNKSQDNITTTTSEYSGEFTSNKSSPYIDVPDNPSRLDNYLDAVADIESSGNPFARASTSSAAGLFQFTRGTWDSMVERYGQATGIGRDDLYDPEAQRTMATFLTMENAASLYRKTGVFPKDRDLYLAHFLGPSRAAQMIKMQGSNLLAASAFPDAAKSNRSLFYKDGVPVTVEELYDSLGAKVERRLKPKK